MPILQNAKKALRSSQRKAKVNQVLKSKTRTLIKKVKTSPTADNISAAFCAVDKSVKKNLMHKNKAARIKSSLSKLEITSDSKPAKAKKPAKSKVATAKTKATTKTKTKAKTKAKTKTTKVASKTTKTKSSSKARK